MKIGFIDSGVGGLSILDAVRRRNMAKYIYLMDNQYLPYGEKSEAFIRERLLQLSRYLYKEHQVDLIVIACNTATTQAVAYLRQHVAIPFVGVVPAIKPAAVLAKEQGFIVLATPATVNSAYLAGLITEFANHVAVHRIGSSQLVKLAEQKVWYGVDVQHEVAAELAIHQHALQHMPVVVLGCTHFPFLVDEIQAASGTALTFIDTADAIARRVAHLYSHLGKAPFIVNDTKTDTPGQGMHEAGDLFISTAALDDKQLRRLPQLNFSDYCCWSEP